MINANNNFYFNRLWNLNVQELGDLPFTEQMPVLRPVAPTFTSETYFAAMVRYFPIIQPSLYSQCLPTANRLLSKILNFIPIAHHFSLKYPVVTPHSPR